MPGYSRAQNGGGFNTGHSVPKALGGVMELQTKLIVLSSPGRFTTVKIHRVAIRAGVLQAFMS